MADSRVMHSDASLSSVFTITTGTEATGYPLTNLNSGQRTKVFRSAASTANVVIVSTFGSQVIKAVGIINYLKFASGSIAAAYWDGGAYQTFGAGTFTLPSPNRTKIAMLYDTTGVTTTRIRITFVYGSAGSASVELGNLWASSYFQPAQNVATGISLTDVDPSIDEESEGGQVHTWLRDPYVVMNVQYRPQGQTDRDSLREIWRVMGRGLPFVFAADPSNMDYTLYARMPRQLRSMHLSNSVNLWDQPWQIEELR